LLSKYQLTVQISNYKNKIKIFNIQFMYSRYYDAYSKRPIIV
jgi:hypothetical protein